MDGTVDEIDIVWIDRLGELHDFGRIDIRVDADDVLLRQSLAELEKIGIVERFSPGQMKVPAQTGIVEEGGQFPYRRRRDDLGA